MRHLGPEQAKNEQSGERGGGRNYYSHSHPLAAWFPRDAAVTFARYHILLFASSWPVRIRLHENLVSAEECRLGGQCHLTKCRISSGWLAQTPGSILSETRQFFFPLWPQRCCTPHRLTRSSPDLPQEREQERWRGAVSIRMSLLATGCLT